MAEYNHESIWSNLMAVSFTQDWVDAGGIRTRFIRAGDRSKPTVVFLHGIAGTWECFCANIGPFAEHFNVYAFDWLGAGLTDKPEQEKYLVKDYVAHLTGFFEAMDIDKASLVGVSLGSWTAINFAYSNPKKVERMVTCATVGLRRTPEMLARAANNIINTRAEAIKNPTWENVAAIFEDLIHKPERRMPDFIKVRQTIYQLPEMKASMSRILANARPENYNLSALSDEQWKEIQTPVLVVESADDSEHFRKSAQRAHSLLPNSELVSMSQVAHWPNWEDAETFNKVALDFLLNQDARKS